jgi:hypothetical protein
MRGNNIAQQWHFSAELFKRFCAAAQHRPAGHRARR